MTRYVGWVWGYDYGLMISWFHVWSGKSYLVMLVGLSTVILYLTISEASYIIFNVLMTQCYYPVIEISSNDYTLIIISLVCLY